MKGCLPDQLPDAHKPFPETNPFRCPALKLTHLSGGEAKAPPLNGPHCPPERLSVQMPAAWRGFHGGLRCGLPATLIHSGDKNKNKQIKKIRQATHVIPGTPARLILCFSIILLSSSPWGGSLLWHSAHEISKPPTGRAPDKELSIAQEFPGRGVFVLVSSP